MPDESHPTRYDTTGNPEAEYIGAARTVLTNKLETTELAELLRAEEVALTSAYQRLLGEVRIATPMTCELIRHIHKCICGHLYDWAGNFRTVWISKPGMTWPAPDFIDQHMRGLSAKLRSAGKNYWEAMSSARPAS